MAASSSKRFWDIALTDPASEHEHCPTRRRLNSSTPFIVIDSQSSGHQAEQVYSYRTENDAISRTASAIDLVSPSSPDPNMPLGGQSSYPSTPPVHVPPPGTPNPDLLSPLRTWPPSDTPEINQGYFNSSPSLSPSGMQMLSLDEMDLDLQTTGTSITKSSRNNIYQ